MTEPAGRRSVLDVNVLLALLDVDHVDHERTSAWLGNEHVWWLDLLPAGPASRPPGAGRTVAR